MKMESEESIIPGSELSKFRKLNESISASGKQE